MRGGAIMGIGQALLEGTITDRPTARILNPGLNEYLVPAHADVPPIDVEFIEEHDEEINVLGVRGIGELPVSGVAPSNRQRRSPCHRRPRPRPPHPGRNAHLGQPRLTRARCEWPADSPTRGSHLRQDIGHRHREHVEQRRELAVQLAPDLCDLRNAEAVELRVGVGDAEPGSSVAVLPDNRVQRGRRHNSAEVRVRGHLGSATRQAFADLQVETRGSDTVLSGELPDQSALHGVLAQIESLGLELLDVRRLPSDG
jgi:Molybdopterin cofactor-binding domain